MTLYSKSYMIVYKSNKGGICIDTSRYMNKIIDVHEEDFDCIVEAGVTREQLNHHIKETGLW